MILMLLRTPGDGGETKLQKYHPGPLLSRKSPLYSHHLLPMRGCFRCWQQNVVTIASLAPGRLNIRAIVIYIHWRLTAAPTPST